MSLITEYWTNTLQQVVKEFNLHSSIDDFDDDVPTWILKFYMCQFVTLLFLFRYTNTSSSKAKSETRSKRAIVNSQRLINRIRNHIHIVSEILLCVIVNIASFYVISTENSTYFTLDLKYAIGIQVIIIYGLFIVDLLVTITSRGMGKVEKAKDTEIEGDEKQNKDDTTTIRHTLYSQEEKEPKWLKHLSHLNDDFLKIILSYNFIIIMDLQVHYIMKVVEFGIKLYCLWIMLRYEFRNEKQDEEEGEDEEEDEELDGSCVIV